MKNNVKNMKTEGITRKIERIINGYTDRLGGSINQSKVKTIAERIVKKCNLQMDMKTQVIDENNGEITEELNTSIIFHKGDYIRFDIHDDNYEITQVEFDVTNNIQCIWI